MTRYANTSSGTRRTSSTTAWCRAASTTAAATAIACCASGVAQRACGSCAASAGRSAFEHVGPVWVLAPLGVHVGASVEVVAPEPNAAWAITTIFRITPAISVGR